ARIHERTEIHPLLCAVRKATDLTLPSAGVVRNGLRLGFELPRLAAIDHWRRGKTYPSGQQVRELMQSYNSFIGRNGFPPLTEDEIAKVVSVAERDFANCQRLSHAQKLDKRKFKARRQPPSPFLDGTDSGR